MYTKDSQSGEYYYGGFDYPGEDYYDTNGDATKILLFWGDVFFTGQPLNTAGTVTIAGRTCTKYTYSDSTYGFGNFASVYFEFCKDNATGVTMKLTAKANANDDSAAYYIEVTDFKTGNSVTVPTLNDDSGEP